MSDGRESGEGKSILDDPADTPPTQPHGANFQFDEMEKVPPAPYVPPQRPPPSGDTERSGHVLSENAASEKSLRSAEEVEDLFRTLNLQAVVEEAHKAWNSCVSAEWQAQFRRQYCLLEAEAFAILALTVEANPSLYGTVGPLMDSSSADVPKKINMIIGLLRSGLQKLPPAESPHEAYRGFRVLSEGLLHEAYIGEEWKEGNSIAFHRFSSFSSSLETACRFSGGPDVRGIVLKVTDGTFRQISTLSSIPAENELMEVPPTTYRITKRELLKPKNVLLVTASPVSDTHSLEGTLVPSPQDLSGDETTPTEVMPPSTGSRSTVPASPRADEDLAVRDAPDEGSKSVDFATARGAVSQVQRSSTGSDVATEAPSKPDEVRVGGEARASEEQHPVSTGVPASTSWWKEPFRGIVACPSLVLLVLFATVAGGILISSRRTHNECFPENSSEDRLPSVEAAALQNTGIASTEFVSEEQQSVVVGDESNVAESRGWVPELVEVVPPTPQLKFELADAPTHHGESNGCRRIEDTTAIVTRPIEANVSLHSLQIGNDVFFPKGCITPGGLFSSAKVESRCTNLIVFQRTRYLVTQDIGSEGRDEWTIEGLVDCVQEPKSDHKDESMRGRNAGRHRRLQFNVSGNNEFTTAHAVHIVSRHGGISVFEDRVPLVSSLRERAIVEAKYKVNSDVNKLLIRTGGVYDQDHECEPEVLTALSPVSNGSSAEFIIYASVPELCNPPPVSLLSSPRGAYFVHQRKALAREEMAKHSIFDPSKPFTAQSITLNFPEKKDLPARLHLPIRLQNVVLVATVVTFPLWSLATDLCVNVVGPVGVGKSSVCGWLFCFFLTDLQGGTINECLLHTNPFERGQNGQFTYTKERLSRASESGVRISDNPGTVKLAADAIDDKTPDDDSLKNELNGQCSGDCSPGECRGKEAKCNPDDLRCPDVDLILVPLADVDSRQPVGGENHPLYYEHKRVALLQEGKHHCKQPVVIVVQVKQAVAGNSASKTITDPAVSVHSALYREAEHELCVKARNALHAHDGTLCVAMSAFVPQHEVDDEWIHRFVEMVRSLQKKLLGAKRKAAEKNGTGTKSDPD